MTVIINSNQNKTSFSFVEFVVSVDILYSYHRAISIHTIQEIYPIDTLPKNILKHIQIVFDIFVKILPGS